VEAWRIIGSKDHRQLEHFLREHNWHEVRDSPRGRVIDSPFLTAKCNILLHINSRMNPQRVPPEACARKACGGFEPWTLTPFVTYQLNFANRSAEHHLPSAALEARVHPTSLLSAIWLQFAEWVTGTRVVRPCERCHQLMDITESPRRRSKRMHQRCSLAGRMARYRLRKKTEATAGH
jgi:hypothetical protein